jgi:glycosyltransferase involved in cell wall biosynthesis
MKILCLDQFASLGGAQRCLADLLPGFLKRGWQPRLAIAGDGPLADICRGLGAPVDILPFQSFGNGRKSFSDCCRYFHYSNELIQAIDLVLQQHRPALLYVNGPRILPAAAAVARRRSLPLVFHCHSRPFDPFAKCALHASLRYAAARIIACCGYAAKPIARFFPAGKLSVIYNGIAETVRYQPRLSIRTIGVVGRIEPEKGQLEFVQAVGYLANEFPGGRFVIVGAPMFSGSRYLDTVVEAARGLPVEFTGWRSDSKSVLSDIDLLVVPSAPIDCTPRVILEAFAAGVPVAAFPAGGIPELVSDGQTGFLTTSNTPPALAIRIRTILHIASAERTAVIERAHKAWREKYNLDRFQQQVADVLLGAIERSRMSSQSRKYRWPEGGHMIHEARHDELSLPD